MEKYHGTRTINKLITGDYWTDFDIIHETTQHSFHDQYSLLLIYQCFGRLKWVMFNRKWPTKTSDRKSKVLSAEYFGTFLR